MRSRSKKAALGPDPLIDVAPPEAFGPALAALAGLALALDLLAGGFGAHRLIAYDVALHVEHWGYVGIDPVMVAVLAAILDDPHPRLAGFQVDLEHRRFALPLSQTAQLTFEVDALVCLGHRPLADACRGDAPHPPELALERRSLAA